MAGLSPHGGPVGWSCASSGALALRALTTACAVGHSLAGVPLTWVLLYGLPQGETVEEARELAVLWGGIRHTIYGTTNPRSPPLPRHTLPRAAQRTIERAAPKTAHACKVDDSPLGS